MQSTESQISIKQSDLIPNSAIDYGQYWKNIKYILWVSYTYQ